MNPMPKQIPRAGGVSAEDFAFFQLEHGRTGVPWSLGSAHRKMGPARIRQRAEFNRVTFEPMNRPVVCNEAVMVALTTLLSTLL